VSRSLANSEPTAYRAYLAEKPWRNDVPLNVRFGPKADMRVAKGDVCLTPGKRTFVSAGYPLDGVAQESDRFAL
jgi:hypothetical protein